MSDWVNRWNLALIQEHKLLFDYDKKTLKEQYAQYVDCPVCGQNDPSLLYEKDWFRYSKCKKCFMVYMNPRLNIMATHQFYNSPANAIYNEAKFYQETSSRKITDQENLNNLHAIDRCKHATRKGKLLEIGSGNGYFLQKAKESGYEVYGIELNKENCKYSRQLIGDTVLDRDLLEAKFPSEMFDVIYMRDLIQHIPNTKEFLLECHRIAKPGCIIYIGTHNIEGFSSRIARAKFTPVFGFMEPNHFSPRTISKMLELTGFAVRDIQFLSLDFTIADIIGYWGESTFTTVYPAKINPLQKSLVNGLQGFFYKRPVRFLDSHIMPHIANALKAGSWMNVLAQKRDHQ